MRRNFLEKFLNKLSDFPCWVKEIIYHNLSKEIGEDDNLAYNFTTYKPNLTEKGINELTFKETAFDNNIYTILNHCKNNLSISEIALNTFMSLEEIAHYFLFCIEEGYIKSPDNSQILNVSSFLAGKYRTGEYFIHNGDITVDQLESAINFKNSSKYLDKRFGQILVEMGFITPQKLSSIISFKQDSQKRIVLDYNEIPSVLTSDTPSDYQKQIEKLKLENSQLKKRIKELTGG